MANEVSVTFGLAYSKGESQLTIPNKRINLDSIAAPKISNTQTIGTTYEALLLGDVASIGAAYFLNVHATSTIQVGLEVSSTFYPLFDLLPGKFAFVPKVSGTLFAKALVAAANLEFHLLSQ
jgi:hypothetical protein